jgi:flavin reductase (DIM6/NTAB) family NADH-FMN oxidoreductase RutF
MLRADAGSSDSMVPAPATAAGADLRAAFVEAMSCSATPVYVVTAAGPAGTHGLTVSAVSTVSVNPPMLLACINRQSPFLRGTAQRHPGGEFACRGSGRAGGRVRRA